jgi:hypothetical protein
MILKLIAHFSYIDDYNRLKFTYLEGTKERLAIHCTTPLPDDEFSVMLSKSTHIPEDIKSLIGLDCTIYVKLTNYNFVSKLKKNFGEKVVGTRLTLNDIRAGIK